MDDDKELFRRFVDGDVSAFEELVLIHKDNLIYFLTRFSMDIHTCEDIAQDVFAFIYAFPQKYHYKNSVKTYLYAIAKNKMCDHLRKYGRTVLLDENYDSVEEESELLKRVVKEEEKALLYHCIDKLKPDYQRIIYLIDFEDLSYKETAVVMNKTIPQIKVLIFRARRSLKILLEKEGYTNED